MHALHHTSEYCPLKSVSSLTQGDQNAGVPLEIPQGGREESRLYLQANDVVA